MVWKVYTPNMPKLLTEKVAPSSSSGFNFPSRALAYKSLNS